MVFLVILLLTPHSSTISSCGMAGEEREDHIKKELFFVLATVMGATLQLSNIKKSKEGEFGSKEASFSVYSTLVLHPCLSFTSDVPSRAGGKGEADLKEFIFVHSSLFQVFQREKVLSSTSCQTILNCLG